MSCAPSTALLDSVLSSCAGFSICQGDDCGEPAWWSSYLGHFCSRCAALLPVEYGGWLPVDVTVSRFRCAGVPPLSMNPCTWPPMDPEREASLRASYLRRKPYWNRDHDYLELFGSLDEARRERDEARAQLAAALVLLEDKRAAQGALLPAKTAEEIPLPGCGLRLEPRPLDSAGSDGSGAWLVAPSA